MQINIVISTYLYSRQKTKMLQFLRPFSSKRFSIERMIISFVWQRYRKRHKKALGKAQKSGAEGESLYLGKGFLLYSRFFSALPAPVPLHKRDGSVCVLFVWFQPKRARRASSTLRTGWRRMANFLASMPLRMRLRRYCLSSISGRQRLEARCSSLCLQSQFIKMC